MSDPLFFHFDDSASLLSRNNSRSEIHEEQPYLYHETSEEDEYFTEEEKDTLSETTVIGPKVNILQESKPVAVPTGHAKVPKRQRHVSMSAVVRASAIDSVGIPVTVTDRSDADKPSGNSESVNRPVLRSRHYSLNGIAFSYKDTARTHRKSISLCPSRDNPEIDALSAAVKSLPETPASSFLSKFYHFETQADFEEGIEIDNLLIGKEIGRGTFSILRKATSIDKGIEFALKIVKKTKDDPETISAFNSFRHEVSLWSLLKHPNIVPLVDTFTVDDYAVAVMPICKGTILEYLSNVGTLDALLAFKYVKQLISATDYLHSMDIAHNDIKLENLLLNESNDIMLCDFGLAYRLKSAVGTNPSIEAYQAGSILYCSPEKLCLISEGKTLCDTQKDGEALPDCELRLLKASDVWSIGVVLYCMLAGSFPFYDEYSPRTVLKIRQGKYDPIKFPKDNPTEEKILKKLLHRTLDVDNSKRASCSQLLEICKASN